MNPVAFMTANWVARETGWAMHGWGHGDRATNDRFRPVETFAERFDALLRDVRALGFDTVDVWGAHLSPEWATDEHLAAAREAVARHGLRVSSYAAWTGARHLRRACDVAAALGTALIGAGYGGDLREAAPVLRERGVRLALENHPERTPDEVRARLEGAEDVAGACVDTGWWGTQGYDPARAIEQLGDAVLHVHLKDVRAQGEPHETCRWGEGIVPVEECVRALRRIGYGGAIAVEHEPEHEDPSEDCGAMGEQLRRWLA